MEDFASFARKKGEVTEESSLPIPDFAVEILLDRFGVDAEFALFCSTLAAEEGRKPGLLMPNPEPFMVTSAPALLPDTALVRFAPALVTPVGVAGESVPIRDRLLPDLGVTFALSGEIPSLVIGAMAGRASRSGDRRDNAGEICGDPASFGAIGLLVDRSLELRAGMRGFAGCPLLVC